MVKKVLERLSDEGLYSWEHEKFNEYFRKDEELNTEVTKGFIEFIVPESPISHLTEDAFDKALLTTYFDGITSKKEINEHSRQELVSSFSKYLLSTKQEETETVDPSDLELKCVAKDSIVYKNIEYTLYKSLNPTTIYNFKPTQLKIKNVSKSAVKIEILVVADVSVSEREALDFLRLFSYRFENYGTGFIKLDIKCGVQTDTYVVTIEEDVTRQEVSLGTVLRSPNRLVNNNKPLLSEFIKDKGTPIILGVSDDQIPYMVDLDKETSINIVGGSGTGKTWLAYNIMFNLMISNTPDDLKVIVFDAKNSPIWNQVALSPHVLGYHIEVDKYAEQLLEVTKELTRRQQILELKEIEDWSNLREELRAEGKYEELVNYPNLVVVMEELNYVTQVLSHKDDKSEYYSLVTALEKISQCGRSVGVHLITFVQHPTESVLSSTLVANASVTIGLKLNATQYYGRLFGEDNLDGLQFPRNAGEGFIQFDDKVVRPLKVLTLGTGPQTSMQKLIRVLSLEWENRKLNQENYDNGMNYIKQTDLVESFNHNKYSKLAKDALENDYILSSRNQSSDEYNDYLLTHKTIKDISGKGLKRLTDLIKQLNK